jgi:hypothetical protein
VANTTAARSREATVTNAGAQTQTAGTARDERRERQDRERREQERITAFAGPGNLAITGPLAATGAFRATGNPNAMLGDWPRRGGTPDEVLRRAMMQIVAPRRGDIDDAAAAQQENLNATLRQRLPLRIEAARIAIGAQEMEQDANAVTIRAENATMAEDPDPAILTAADDAMILD